MPKRPDRKGAERQRKREHDRTRPSAWRRGYDADWRRLRRLKLETDPLCECDDCQAGKIRTKLATVVDHKISIEERPDLRLDWDNLRSMAEECHNRRTAREQGFAKTDNPRGYSGDVGADGMPTDPDHPWYAAE